MRTSYYQRHQNSDKWSYELEENISKLYITQRTYTKKPYNYILQINKKDKHLKRKKCAKDLKR